MKDNYNKSVVLYVLLQSIAYIIGSSNTQNRLLILVYIIFMLVSGMYWILFGFKRIKTEVESKNITLYKLIKIMFYVFLILIWGIIIFGVLKEMRILLGFL